MDDDLPSAVAETARDGSTTTRGEVDVPEAPIETDDGSYYRVERVAIEQPDGFETVLVNDLRYLAPVLGLLVLARVVSRFDVTSAGDEN